MNNHPMQASLKRDPYPKHTLNTRVAAEYLDLQPQTLRSWRRTRRGPTFHRLGRRIVYVLADLDTFLARHRVETHDAA